MRTLVSRNRCNSAALEKVSLKQPGLLRTAQQSQFLEEPTDDRSQPSSEILKRFRPASRRCVLARRFYPKYRSGRAVAWLSDAVWHQFFLDPTVWRLGIVTTVCAVVSKDSEKIVRRNSEAVDLSMGWSRS